MYMHAKSYFPLKLCPTETPVYRGRKVYISNETHLYSSLSHIWYVQSIEVNCFFFITSGNNPIVVNNTQCRGLYSFVNFSASAVCYTNPLITGRYVGISNVGKQALQLCEVEIYLRGTCHCTQRLVLRKDLCSKTTNCSYTLSSEIFSDHTFNVTRG